MDGEKSFLSPIVNRNDLFQKKKKRRRNQHGMRQNYTFACLFDELQTVCLYRNVKINTKLMELCKQCVIIIYATVSVWSILFLLPTNWDKTNFRHCNWIEQLLLCTLKIKTVPTCSSCMGPDICSDNEID